MMGFREHPIVQLATLGEVTKDLSTIEHFRNLGQLVSESYRKDHSVLQALKEAVIFDTLVTASRMTYLYSKIQHKIPERMQPNFIRYSVPGMAADLLATYHGY